VILLLGVVGGLNTLTVAVAHANEKGTEFYLKFNPGAAIWMTGSTSTEVRMSWGGEIGVRWGSGFGVGGFVTGADISSLVVGGNTFYSSYIGFGAKPTYTFRSEKFYLTGGAIAGAFMDHSVFPLVGIRDFTDFGVGPTLEAGFALTSWLSVGAGVGFTLLFQSTGVVLTRVDPRGAVTVSF
jgi:hypothetical protein